MKDLEIDEKVLWIAWERHRRTIEICDFLGIEPVVFDAKLPIFVRHAINIIKTSLTIHTKKPKVLIVQNPSIALTLMACLLHSFYKYSLIVDSHNVGIIPENYILQKLRFLYRYFQKNADVTIVTNNGLAEIVRNNKGRPFVLPDRIPKPQTTRKMKLEGKHNVAYICTFKSDEPYQNIFEAAKGLGNDVYIYVTGNFKRCPSFIMKNLSKNIIFTGFLDDNDYWSLLSSVDLIIDLTSRENCLVCGGYEAVAVECPLILSNTTVLKKHFSKGVLFTEKEISDIIRTIKYGIKINSHLKKEICALKMELVSQWDIIGKQLRAFILG